jgi:hypothetical protein
MVIDLLKKFIYLVLFGFIYSSTCTDDQENLDWCFEVSMQQGFYFFQNIAIDGLDIYQGSVVGANDGVWQCPDGDCDVIAAFYDDVCVGWTYPYYNFGFTVPVMIDDGTDQTTNYPSPGDIPEFRLYDNSSNSIYIANANSEIPPIYNNDFNIIEELSSGPLNLDNIDLPSEFNISDIYPNPFNASTTISYSIPNLSDIKVSVFNILGQEIITLFNSEQLPGFHTITWDAGDISSGFYIIRLENNTGIISKKVLLVK